jgi:spore germination protein YaaH
LANKTLEREEFRVDFFLKYRKIITFLLLILFLLPLFIIISTTAAYSAGLEWVDKYPWLKGILLFLFALFLNKYTDNNVEDEQVNSVPVYEGEEIIIESKDFGTEKEVLAFHVNWLTSDEDSTESLKRNWQNIDMLVPFWYTVKADGSIVSRYGGYQYEVDSFSKSRNIKVLPLINNSQENNMILVDPATRSRAVNNIVELVKKNDFAGVNIDFEHIPPWTRNGYTAFIKELSEKLRIINRLTTISVFPKIDVPLDLQGAYNYAALAPLVDRIIIMTYDHHWAKGPAGPIASIGWVEKNILYALEYIPADKILLGIANYGYDWSGGYGQDISARRAVQLAEEKGAEIKWHETHQAPYFYYWEGSKKHEVWFENSNSLAFKLDLVNKYNLRGIGIWRLGNEKERFWNIIENKLKNM